MSVIRMDVPDHAVHSTASWTRSEGIWVGPDFPFPDGL